MKNLTQEEVDELLEQFSKMLDGDYDDIEDFASVHGLTLDFDSDDEEEQEELELEFSANKDAEIPPPMPKCQHKNKRVNRLSMTLQFWYCPDCKADLGDYKE